MLFRNLQYIKNSGLAGRDKGKKKNAHVLLIN